MGNFSRRDFLKGVAASAASIAGMSVLNTVGAGVKANAEFADATPVENKLYTAYVNPQLDDAAWRTNTKELKMTFSPLTIGNITINNRFVKSAAGSATYLNGLTDELFEYYVNFAKGGVELIYVEMVKALELPESGEYSPEVLEWGNRLADTCAQYGAKLGYQFYGTGSATGPIEDVIALRDSMIKRAVAIGQLGIKAVEFNCAGFNLGAHFLSRYHNTRTDEYGPDSLENRSRFIVELIKGVKEQAPDMNVQILMDCVEENDNLDNGASFVTLDNTVSAPHTLVNTIEEGIEFGKIFEAAGADSLHLRLGPLGHHVAQFAADLYFIANGIEGVTGFGTQFDFERHWEGKLIGNTSGCGMTLNVGKMFKEQINIPIGLVTYMDPAHAPDFFETALEEGKFDFYIMNRPLTVDTEYVNKLKEGRIDEIAPCTRCLHCHIAGNEGNRQFGYCRVNALTQRVMTENGPATYEVPEAETKKKVMVIGGGPAGMEAARIAAMRGHDVTLYEKRANLGFMLDFAEMVKGKHENLGDLKKYLIRQLELKGVTVKTGVEVTPELVKEENPDAVICAVGGIRDTLKVEGNAPVIGIEEFMFKDMGKHVVVYGSNAQACDTALWLTVQKKKHVTIVTPSPLADLDIQQSQHANRMLTTALYSLGVQAYCGAQLVSAEDGTATIVTDAGVTMKLPCDAIVDAADMLPNTELAEAIGEKACTIGDAAKPYNIALAIRGGNDAGRAV